MKTEMLPMLNHSAVRRVNPEQVSSRRIDFSPSQCEYTYRMPLRDLFRKKLANRIAVYVGSLMVGCIVLFFLSAAILKIFSVPLHSGMWRLIGLLLVYIVLSTAVIIWAVGKTIGRPVHELMDVMRVAEAGDFLVRAGVKGEDEIGQLASKFNEMLARITDLTAKNIDKERELIFAKEELKYKKIIEKKGRIIEKRNRELGALLKDLSVLYNINQVISSTIELKDLYNVITNVVAETFGYKEFAILLLDEEKNTLRVVASYGFQQDERIMGMEFKLGEGVSGIAAESGRRILIKDTRKDSRYLHYKGEKKEEGSFLSIPIKLKDRVLGVINFNSNKMDGFPAYDIRLLTAVANYLAVAIENARLYEKTRYLSITDDLTGLINRRYFNERLDKELMRAERFKQPLSLLMADIDSFKSLNDSYGHLHGDEVLREIARMLQGNTRGIDIVGRFGGEEFAILLPQTGLQDALRVAEKLLLAVREYSFRAPESRAEEKIALSIGVSCFPETCRDRDTLVKQADEALNLSKRAGRDKVMAYTESPKTRSLVVGGKS